MKNKPRIVFFGTPEFAVASLESIVNSGYPVIAIVTALDRPAGRGLKLKASPVKEFAVNRNIPVLQPVSLGDPAFHGKLHTLSPDIQVVVAFRMLPREVWSFPPFGTFNLHASLLPRYRGAAPINWALINGETETGVTTFFLEETIDTGNILFTGKTQIPFSETAGELHDRLMVMGADLVVKTLGAIESGAASGIRQDTLADPSLILKKAPKINREDCLINWDNDVVSIHNLIRGLSPYPGAHTVLKGISGEPVHLKIFRAEPQIQGTGMIPGEFVIEGRSGMKVAGRDGFLLLQEVQVTGHRVMAIPDFLNGFGRLFS